MSAKKNSPFKERLLEFLKYCGEGQKAFELRNGLSNGAINNITDSFKPANIQKVKDNNPNLNIDWLLSGEGQMLKGGEPETAKDKMQKHLNNVKNNAKGVLEYYDGATPAAGREGEADITPVNKTERKLYISDLFRGSQFAVRISGNSMIPNYPPGAIIGIRQIYDKSIIPGSVYVVETADELYIKRLYYKDDDQDSGAFQCISDNTIIQETGVRKGRPCYPVFYKKFEEIRKLFKVTGIYKPNELTLIN